jgi:type I restriction enzyme, S subunit
MNKDKLIPELRFPEFENDGEWCETNLGDIGDFIGGGTPDTTKAEYWNGDIQWYTPTEVKEGKVGKSIRTITELGLKNSSAKLLPKGSLLLTTRATIGDIAIADFECTTNQGFQSLVVKETEINTFWFYWIIRHKNELIKKSSGSTFPEIGKTEITKINALKPNKPEQQKIASCLLSLDEAIATHSQKLDLLKDHKKGLMQNLFPQEGEKVPKYRFKEFEKDGEWVDDILFNLAKNGFSNGVFNDPKKVGSGYKLINVINMYTESPICENDLSLLELSQSEFEKNKVEFGDIFFTRSSLVPEGIAKSNIYLGSSDDITYDGHLIRMQPKKELTSPIFLHYLLKTENVRRQMIAKGKTATMTTIGQSDVASVEISYSKNPKEQQKIASCLSSLDALITAQAEKIEQLKLHKKGLMQGLFPKINE